MPKPHIDYAGIRHAILVMMGDALFKDQNMEFDAPRIRARLPILANAIKISLEQLHRDGLIDEVLRQQNRSVGVLGQTVREFVSTGRYELTDDGRRYVEKLPDAAFELAVAEIESGATAERVYRVAGAPDVPSPPLEWKPLEIEVGSSEVQAVERALEDVVKAVSQDNGYKVTCPDERAEILAAFKGAKELLLEASQLSYTSFSVYLVWPLERLLSRFKPDTVIGAVVMVLKDAVKDWAKAKLGTAFDHILK